MRINEADVLVRGGRNKHVADDVRSQRSRQSDKHEKADRGADSDKREARNAEDRHGAMAAGVWSVKCVMRLPPKCSRSANTATQNTLATISPRGTPSAALRPRHCTRARTPRGHLPPDTAPSLHNISPISPPAAPNTPRCRSCWVPSSYCHARLCCATSRSHMCSSGPETSSARHAFQSLSHQTDREQCNPKTASRRVQQLLVGKQRHDLALCCSALLHQHMTPQTGHHHAAIPSCTLQAPSCCLRWLAADRPPCARSSVAPAATAPVELPGTYCTRHTMS